MRNGRNAVAALTLALLLTTPTFAGIMTAELAPPPPPPTATGIMVTDLTDDGTQTSETTRTPEATDTVTKTALTLLQSMLTLF